MSKNTMIYLFIVPALGCATLLSVSFMGLGGLWKMLGITDIMFVIWGCGHAILFFYIAVAVAIFALKSK